MSNKHVTTHSFLTIILCHIQRKWCPTDQNMSPSVPDIMFQTIPQTHVFLKKQHYNRVDKSTFDRRYHQPISLARRETVGGKWCCYPECRLLCLILHLHKIFLTTLPLITEASSVELRKLLFKSKYNRMGNSLNYFCQSPKFLTLTASWISWSCAASAINVSWTLCMTSDRSTNGRNGTTIFKCGKVQWLIWMSKQKLVQLELQ